MKALQAQYKKRADQFEELAVELANKYNRYSLIRLLSFVVAIALIILIWREVDWWAGILASMLAIAGFGRFMHWHQAIKEAQRHHEFLSQINQEEQQYLSHDFSAFGDGTDFQNPNHPYSYDLDVFGPYSFYQSINRTSTVIGAQRLADYLQAYTNLENIQQRQTAIQELSVQLDWRQHFQAKGKAVEDALQHIEDLKIWLSEAPFASHNRFYQLMRWISPVFALAGLILWLKGTPGMLAILTLLPAGWVLRQSLEQVNIAHNQTGKAGAILEQYGQLIAQIETGSFKAPLLQNVQNTFSKNNQTASAAIKRLSYLVTQLNLRDNGFTILINISCLWDIHWVTKLEHWKAQYKEELLQWFDAMAEMEALHSLGNMLHNNPEWIFPVLSESPAFEGEGLGHPLIERNKRITNDIHIPTKGHIKLVTGSNMAGKSTFLRTVGLNIVLANVGAPVCATRMQLPLLKVYTSMRTTDALHESTSSFYAELKRLKFIIDAVESGDNIFFLLDEILKGTNSKDRHTGSRALIEQLIEDEGSGIIATHDLDLGVLEANANGAIENLRIEVDIKDDQLHFDYKIKKGVSESFNATHLMRNMGIKIGRE